MMLNKKSQKQRGATMVEYALIVVAIALVAYAGAKLLGQSVSAKFNTIGDTVRTAS